MSLKETDFSVLKLEERKNLLEKKDIMDEFASNLNPKKEIQIQSIKDKTTKKYTIYGWEPAVILKFKYISKNKMTPKKKDEFWERVIWNGNIKLDDTDILDNPDIKLKTPFRFLTKEESETSGQSKIVRNILKDDGKVKKEINKPTAATKIQAVQRGNIVRNQGKKKIVEPPNGSCEGTNEKCPVVDKRIKGKKMSNIGRQAICKSYAGCDWIKKGGRKKKRKKKKAFPSRRKNNRKNRTKKKALSK